MLYLSYTGGREHTMSAEPGGHTSCYYPTKEQVGYTFLPVFVCLSVSEITQKRPIRIPDAGTALLSPISYGGAYV